MTMCIEKSGRRRALVSMRHAVVLWALLVVNRLPSASCAPRSGSGTGEPPMAASVVRTGGALPVGMDRTEMFGPPTPDVAYPIGGPGYRLSPPEIKAASVILIDAVTGQVLYAKNPDLPRPMASTTKIMTALLFCESVAPGAIVTAGPHACKTRESSLHLKAGERLSAEDMLCAILMRSANDACVAAAEHIAGSEAAFAEKMNARAAALGATHTHFVNSHGLHAKTHYTTARDLALIARAALQEPRIESVVRTRRCRITRSLNRRDVHLRNHSHFLGKFPGADGVKTGWTVPAGHCYVGSATWGRWRLISVVLKSPDYVAETAALMKYGFLNFLPHPIAYAGDPAGICPVANGAQSQVPVVVRNTVQAIGSTDRPLTVERRVRFQEISAPVQAGAVVGALEAHVDGKLVCASPLLAAESIPQHRSMAAHVLGHDHGIWKNLLLTSGLLTGGLVSLRYGRLRQRIRFTAAAKGSRRRRRRLAKSL